jgi:hypothetical protein
VEQIEFVKSGLMTSRIGLGTWAMGGWMWGGTDEAQSTAVKSLLPNAEVLTSGGVVRVGCRPTSRDGASQKGLMSSQTNCRRLQFGSRSA